MHSAPGVSHVPSPNHLVLFPVISHNNSVCVPSIFLSIDAEKTHFSDPYNRISCITALWKLSDTLVSAPSHQSSIPCLPQTYLARMMFRRTAGQSSSIWSMGCPRYWKVRTFSIISSPSSSSRLNVNISTSLRRSLLSVDSWHLSD